MAIIQIEIPDAQVQRVKDAMQELAPLVLGDQYEVVSGKKPGQALTNLQASAVVKALFKSMLLSMVKQYEANAAAEAARAAAIQNVDAAGLVL